MLLDASDSYAPLTPDQWAPCVPAVLPQYQAQILALETWNNGNLTFSPGYLLQSFTIPIVRCSFLMYNPNLPCCNSGLLLTDLSVKDWEHILQYVPRHTGNSLLYIWKLLSWHFNLTFSVFIQIQFFQPFLNSHHFFSFLTDSSGLYLFFSELSWISPYYFWL